MIFETLFSIFVVALAVWIYKDNFKTKRPPGPFRLPLIGNIIQLGVDKSTPQHESFRKLSQKYGPISTIQLALYPGVIFDDFETIKKLLNHELWVDRFYNSFFATRSFGKVLGIIFINGDTWKEMRRFAMRTLRDFGYGKKSMESVLEDEVKDLLIKIEELRKEDSKSIVAMKSTFAMPVLNVLWSMVCCTRSSDDDKRLKEMLVWVDKLARATPIGGGVLMPFPFLRHIFPDSTGFTFIHYYNAKLQGYFWDVLRRRREEGVYKTDQRDYIDVFMKEIDHHREQGSNPNYYTDEQFVVTSVDLFEAGAETTNNTLEFAIWFMIQNPMIQKKVQDEIDRVVGKNRFPTYATDKIEMPYTEAVLTEVQRMSNVLPMTVRSPTEDVWVDGYFIKKGTVGFMNLFSVHMDEKFWGDPEKFRPERFLDSNMNLIATKTQRVLPFGGGKRVCIGEVMARATLFTYFTGVLQHFSFEKCSIDSETDKPTMLGFTLTPAPYSALITKR